ncbi:immunity protein Imm33 domain-containing protein [Duganella aceris]|nr:hypothetical protein [Duganella aceris]
MSTDQQQVCQRYNVQCMPPAGHEKVGIALATLANVPLHAARVQPENGDCGWYIYGGEYSTDTDFYQPLCAAHLSEYCDKIVPYLGLPPGWRVLLAPNYEDVWFDEELLISEARDA